MGLLAFVEPAFFFFLFCVGRAGVGKVRERVVEWAVVFESTSTVLGFLICVGTQ